MPPDQGILRGSSKCLHPVVRERARIRPGRVAPCAHTRFVGWVPAEPGAVSHRPERAQSFPGAIVKIVPQGVPFMSRSVPFAPFASLLVMAAACGHSNKTLDAFEESKTGVSAGEHGGGAGSL